MKRTHGMSRTRLYRIWCGMKSRCQEGSKISHKIYFGKGIVVCKEWKEDFISFYEWAMDNGYSEDFVLDRINPDGNYEPSNCQWITKSENSAKAWTDTGIHLYMKKYAGTNIERLKNYDKAL